MQVADEDKYFKVFLSRCLNLTNLLVFIYLMSAASFDFYLINFYLKYIPGNIFINTIVSSASSSASCYIAGIIIIKMGSRNGMCVAFTMCFLSGIVLLISESGGDDSTLMISAIPFAVLSAQFGASCAFGMLYMCTLQFFPSQFLGTVFGVCNVTARSITILSPMVAEADHPIPEVLIITTCLGAAIMTRFLRTPNFMNKVDENKLEREEKKKSKKSKKHR